MLRYLRIATAFLFLPPLLSAQDLSAINQQAKADFKAKRYKQSLAGFSAVAEKLERDFQQQWIYRAAIAAQVAGCHAALQQNEDASRSYSQAVLLLSKESAPPSATAAAIRLNAARFHLDTLKDWQTAEQVLTPALTSTPPSDPAHTSTLTLARTTLGEIQRDSLRWSEAIETLESATADLADLPVPEDPQAARDLQLETARAHHSLGRLLLDLGENTSALDHLQRANKIYFSNVREAGSPNRVNPRINLARAHIALGQSSIATDILDYTLAELVSPDARQRPDNAELETRTLQALASAHFESENFNEAVRYNRMIVAPQRTALVSPTETATSLSNLAIAELLATGDTTSASKNIDRAFELFASLPTSLDLFEHRFSAHFNRAMIRHHAGDAQGALADARAALAEVRKSFEEVFLYLSPQVRLAYSQKLVTYPFYLAGTLADPAFAAELTIQIKGLVSDSVARDRALIASIEKTANTPDFEDLRRLQYQFATLSLRGEDTSQSRADIRALRASILGDRSGTFPDTPPSLAEVQSALAPDEAAFDFFTFRNNRAAGGWTRDIAAVVLRRGHPPRLYTLSGEQLDRLDSRLGELDRRLTALTSKAMSSALGGDPDTWCRDVYTLLFGHTHARQALTGSSTLTLSLDGALHGIPFPALRGSGGAQLITTHTIRQVRNLRSLVKPPATPSPAGSPRTALLVANPEYVTAPPPVAVTTPLLADSGTRTTRHLRTILSPGAPDDPAAGQSNARIPILQPLPGTEAEVEKIARLLREAGYRPVTRKHGEPTEPEIRASLGNAHIIHLATHGFYIPTAGAPNASPGSTGLDPMLRSGLALVGAEHTMQAWRDLKFPDTASDGILLAAELSSLDLTGTELVVLSACDSGRGKSASGQGVLGLPSALVQAGCQHAVTTLWPIDDEKTVTIMEQFYRSYLGGTPPHSAMADALRRFLQENPSANPWQSFFVSAPFVVTGSGPLD